MSLQGDSVRWYLRREVFRQLGPEWIYIGELGKKTRVI